MTGKTLILGALALALAGAPAAAQTSGDKSMMSNGMMSNGMMAKDHMMANGKIMKMTKAQMASMKRCKAMSRAGMMKNKMCMSMMKMHPGMMKKM